MVKIPRIRMHIDSNEGRALASREKPRIGLRGTNVVSIKWGNPKRILFANSSIFLSLLLR